MSKPASSQTATAFEWWLGGGKPLDPYLKGRLWWWVLNQVKPKDIRFGDCLGSPFDTKDWQVDPGR